MTPSEPITHHPLPITFKVGDRVTVKSILAKYLLLGRPTDIEIAAYPNLVGVPLTIESIDEPWIMCVRENGSRTRALLAEDLELLEACAK